MIIAGLMGSVAAAGGPVFTNQASWSLINFSTAQEGQENYFNVSFTDWDGTSTFYYSITSPGNTVLTSQFDTAEGTYVPGQGDSTGQFIFTATADSTTDGAMDYYIRGGSGYFYEDYFNQGAYTIRDSSKTPALVLDLDSNNWASNSWTDTSGQDHGATTHDISKSTDNGGVLILNGTSSYAAVSSLNNSNYGSVTVGAWIKPTVINRTQTIISKELCYKLNITSNGRIVWMVGSASDSSWTTTFYSGYDLIPAGVWSHVMATVSANATKIYINGVLAASSSGVILVSNGQPFNIGTYAGAQGDFFGGRVGEVKMWNYAITEANIISEYNSTASRYGQSPIPLSLDFPGVGNPYLLVSNTQSDWNLGTTYTIEFWSKGGNASNGAIRTVASQGPGNGIDIGYISTHLLFRNSEPQYPEPTPGVWTHVAFVNDGEYVNLYYNGVYQTNFNPNGGLIDGGSDLNIGRRAGVNGQGFYGKLAMLHIYNAVKYTANFNPSVSYGSQDGSVLLLSSGDPFTDIAGYELNGVNTSANNLDTLYFSKATYPDLNTQIHAGDTVVNVAPGSLVNSITTGAVFTPNGDPDNWGVHVSPGWPAVDTVNFSGLGRHPVSVQGAVTTSSDFPSYQSLEFNNPQQDYLSTPSSADWNLGNNWTIEFWIKSNNNSANNINIPGGQWALINQGGWYGGMPDDNCILVGMTAGALTINQSANSDISFVEPTTRVWTHVAIVNNGGGSAQKVYYNGVEQTPLGANYTSNGKTNTTEALYIGRLKPSSGGLFDGKMAMVRISNAAKYLANFTATTTYGVEADTKLFLGKVNPTVDDKAHAITNNGVALISDFPVAPASITITNVSISGSPNPPVTVDFTSTVSATTTGTIFFAWGNGTSGPYTLTVNPGSNVYTSPGLSNLNSSGIDFITQITIASGPNACTSNIFTSAWDVVCLVEGTMITMADGSHKAIEEIKYTDLIRVWNFDLGEFSEALPIFVKREETYAKHYRFTFSDGTVLRTVGHHVFNKQAGEFTMLIRDTTPVGTITFNELGEEVTLISKEIIDEPVKFYNVWTQYHLNMFADGILTSNRFNNIYPICDMKFVKDTRTLRPLEEFADIDPKYISGLRLQEQPKQYSAEYIKDYVDNKLVRLDVANTSKALS